jgi:hypothetical protein
MNEWTLVEGAALSALAGIGLSAGPARFAGAPSQ